MVDKFGCVLEMNLFCGGWEDNHWRLTQTWQLNSIFPLQEWEIMNQTLWEHYRQQLGELSSTAYPEAGPLCVLNLPSEAKRKSKNRRSTNSLLMMSVFHFQQTLFLMHSLEKKKKEFKAHLICSRVCLWWAEISFWKCRGWKFEKRREK